VRVVKELADVRPLILRELVSLVVEIRLLSLSPRSERPVADAELGGDVSDRSAGVPDSGYRLAPKLRRRRFR